MKCLEKRTDYRREDAKKGFRNRKKESGTKERDFVVGKRMYEGERSEKYSKGNVKIRRSILSRARYQKEVHK